MCINREGIVCNEPDIISGPSLEVFVNPIDKVVKRFIGFNVGNDLVTFVQLAVLLVKSVQLGRLGTHLAVWVDEPLKGWDRLVLRYG